MCDVLIIQTIRTKNAVEFKSCIIFVNAGKKGKPNQQLERENAANQRKKETTLNSSLQIF